MVFLPKKLQQKLANRENENSLRSLQSATGLIDFSSNDYLGFAGSGKLFMETDSFLKRNSIRYNGATGSRLLTGNHDLYEIAEQRIADFHSSPSALIFNSGYDANIGFFGSVPQRGDVILYDEFVHASIRDGIRLSNANGYKFKHNHIESLEQLILKYKNSPEKPSIYVVTESVFSMDGSIPDLKRMAMFATENNALLIVDEAHALGISSRGLINDLSICENVFARIITFGKALGCHGAAVLGSEALRNYLINFARSLIYTTAMSPHSVATIISSYELLDSSFGKDQINRLNSNIAILRDQIVRYNLEDRFVPSRTAIHACLVGDNLKTRNISRSLANEGFDVRPILSPTVAQGQEQLRICVHSFNSEEEICKLVEQIANFTL